MNDAVCFNGDVCSVVYLLLHYIVCYCIEVMLHYFNSIWGSIIMIGLSN